MMTYRAETQGPISVGEAEEMGRFLARYQIRLGGPGRA